MVCASRFRTREALESLVLATTARYAHKSALMGSAVSCTSFAIMERGRRSNRVRPLDDISSSSSLSSVGCDSFARVASLVPSSDEERWQFIDLTCQHEAKRIEQDHTRDWKTLRIFVSSTFSDFRAVSVAI